MTTVGIVGAGTMGAGIAQVALEAGDEVVLHDVDPAAVDRARDRVRDGLDRRAARLEPPPSDAGAWREDCLQRLRSAVTLDALAAEADLVIEAAIEDLELKRTIFRALDAGAGPEVILATNTSALSVAAIAAATARPDRVIGLHFFHPVPRMGLVEVAVTEAVPPAIANRAEAIVRRWGKTTVRCADTPGFIVNRVNRPFTIEALRALERGDASAEAIDAVVRAAGFPMGPFELMDLVGIDVNLAAARNVWAGLGRPEELRPSPLQEALVEGGRLGRKTGEGFYEYRGGTRVPGPVSGDGRPVLERILAGIEREARAMAEAGSATRPDIDLALRLGAGHPARADGPAGPSTL